MRLSRKTIRRFIKEEYNLLTEQEDLFGGDEEAAEEEDVGGEAEEEAEGAEEEGEAETEEEEVEPAIDETDPLAKSVDDELNAIFVDFETEAIDDAAAADIQNENRMYSLTKVLYEQEETPHIDMETFAANVARLVQNYDSLLDMKAIIVKKAQDYIVNKYDADLGSALLDILDLRYDISLELPEDMVDPMAVGASPTAAEGGA